MGTVSASVVMWGIGITTAEKTLRGPEGSGASLGSRDLGSGPDSNLR